jgi:GntR family transcriptional regulator
MEVRKIALHDRDRSSLVEQVYNDLARRIRSGEYEPGRQLPSEPALASAYRVSRMTVREAIKGLQKEYLLHTQRGNGTFVTRSPIKRPITRLQSGSELTADLGYQMITHVVAVTVESADSPMAQALDVPIGTPLLRLERVRSLDGRPALYSIDTFDARWVEEDRPLEAWEGSLFAYIQERTNRSINHTTATLRATLLEPETSRRIGSVPGLPWFLMEQVNYDTENRPLLVSLDYHAGDLFGFEVVRRRT